MLWVEKKEPLFKMNNGSNTGRVGIVEKSIPEIGSMGSDIQYHSNDIKDGIPSPQQLAHWPERPPIEHQRSHIKEHIGDPNGRLKGGPELDLSYIVDVISKDGKEQEQESSQPEMPAFSSPHQNDADDHCRDTQGIDQPAIFQCIAFEERFPKGKMQDKNDLEGEGPDDK